MEKGSGSGPTALSASAQHHLPVRLGLPGEPCCAVFHLSNGAWPTPPRAIVRTWVRRTHQCGWLHVRRGLLLPNYSYLVSGDTSGLLAYLVVMEME